MDDKDLKDKAELLITLTDLWIRKLVDRDKLQPKIDALKAEINQYTDLTP